jgi:hypothetical protein
MKNYIIETFCHQRRQFLSALKFAVVTLLLFLYSHVSVLASESKTDEAIDLTSFLAFEIEGVSLDTPFEAIPEILEKHGFTQTSNTTYTKRNQIPGQRRSLYRIEVNDTESMRHIAYYRGKSGGRVKSSVKQEKPILPNEADMAKELFGLVCIGVTALEQSERSCLPVTKAHISFAHGEFLEIGGDIGVQLSASATTTTIAVKYSK